MVAIVGLFIEIGALILTGIVNAILFLLRRIDITNSLLASSLVQALTFKMDISAGIRWAMFIGLVIVSLVAQHMFKAAKIGYGIFSILAVGAIAYGWTNYDSASAQYTAIGIAMVIAGILNVIGWGGIVAEKSL